MYRALAEEETMNLIRFENNRKVCKDEKKKEEKKNGKAPTKRRISLCGRFLCAFLGCACAVLCQGRLWAPLPALAAPKQGFSAAFVQMAPGQSASAVLLQAPSAPAPDLYATSAVLMDGESGKVLYGKSEETPLANASTTKIMTCILVLENCDPEERLTVSAYAASMPKVKLYLQKGEEYTVRELLYSLMLESHNDSAVALAEHVAKKWTGELSGKEAKDFTAEESRLALKAFSGAMNEKALMIGCSDTYFITPNGLDATETLLLEDGTEKTLEHHMTARDLALILSYCILRSPQKEAFLEITRKASYSFSENQRSYALSNHNSFLGMMDGALSGKTGFTGKAGYCYTGALERDGRVFVVALLACGWPNNKSYKWTDTRKLMEYGLAHFRRVNLLGEKVLYDEGALPKLPVLEGQTQELGAPCTVALRITGREGLPGDQGILMSEEEKVTVSVSLKKELEAPVREGAKVGEIRYVVGEEVYRTEDIVAAGSVDRIDYRWCLQKVLTIFTKFFIK